MQLNLLPDVKMEYIKTQRARRLILSVSVLVAAVALALLLLLLGVDGLQKKHLSDLNKDIKSESAKLQGEPQIEKMLTVQNQLQSLPALHAAKPAAARLFDYLNQLTPANVAITDFTIDFGKQTIAITGTSANLVNVNQYVDTLKYTTYTTGSNSNAQNAFSNVVMSSFGLNTDTQNAGQAATYTINMSYDKTIFDITQDTKLTVPSVTTTRLTTGVQASDLFQPAPAGKGGQ